jgi:hypothetical protein
VISESNGLGPVFRTEPISLHQLLVLPLALFGSLGARARGFGLGFPLGRVTLGVGFVLLSLALFDDIVATGHGSGNLFGLTLDALDGSLDAFFRSALLIPHGSNLLLVLLSALTG